MKSGDDYIKKKSVLLIIFILWILIIFINSSQTGVNSNAISYKIVRAIARGFEGIGFEPITAIQIKKLNLIIRKVAHGFQFFVFAIVLRFLFEHLNIKRENIVFCTLLSVIFFAVGDEFHQLFVSGRTPSVIDVIIDFLGGVFGVISVSILKNISLTKTVASSGE